MGNSFESMGVILVGGSEEVIKVDDFSLEGEVVFQAFLEILGNLNCFNFHFFEFGFGFEKDTFNTGDGSVGSFNLGF